MIVYLYAVLQVQAVQPIPQTAPEAASQVARPVLWRDLQKGIAPEQFAEALQKVDGVESVVVTRNAKKANKPAKVKIVYSNGKGLQIGDLNVAIAPLFISDQLESISLFEQGCYSVIDVKIKKLFAVLGEKYPQQQKVTVVDPDGVSIDKQQAFYNQETRVTVSSVAINNSYPQHIYGGSGFIAAANNLANSLADSAYNDANRDCPLDKGRKATLKLDYVSQQDFMVEHNRETVDQAAKAKATKDGL